MRSYVLEIRLDSLIKVECRMEHVQLDSDGGKVAFSENDEKLGQETILSATLISQLGLELNVGTTKDGFKKLTKDQTIDVGSKVRVQLSYNDESPAS